MIGPALYAEHLRTNSRRSSHWNVLMASGDNSALVEPVFWNMESVDFISLVVRTDIKKTYCFVDQIRTVMTA